MKLGTLVLALPLVASGLTAAGTPAALLLFDPEQE